MNEDVNMQTRPNRFGTNTPLYFGAVQFSSVIISFSKYFVAVFIGVFRALPNI